MFKSNLSSNPMLPSKKRPVLFKETADDTPPSTPVPKDPFINPANSNTYDSAGIGTRTDLERKIGAIPSSVNERFQWYLENNKNQGDKTARSNNIILDSVHNIKYPSILPKIPGQTKQNSNNGATNGNKPASPVDLLARPWQQEKPDASGVPSKGNSSTDGIPDEHAELAAIVEKLPEDFDFTQWENMTALQQQKALMNSSLSGTDQMKLLNAPTSIKTIATIQDIQANRAQYGITQARANEISSELLKIANARIGVSNRALPFASAFQRNLFLKQLDKEEQKLLESAGGQDNGAHDKVFKDNNWFDSNQPVKTPSTKIINEVDNNSKLASVAKEILKAYMGIKVILPATLAMISMQEIGRLIDKGTISVGVSLTGVYLGGATVNGGLVVDHAGDVGIIITHGGYAGTPSASAVGFASISNADSIKGLEGQSFEIGGSGGVGLSVGGEACIFTDNITHEPKLAVNLNIGAGVTPIILPAEGHAGIVNSTVMEAFNVFDTWNAVLKEYNKW